MPGYGKKSYKASKSKTKTVTKKATMKNKKK